MSSKAPDTEEVVDVVTIPFDAVENIAGLSMPGVPLPSEGQRESTDAAQSIPLSMPSLCQDTKERESGVSRSQSERRTAGDASVNKQLVTKPSMAPTQHDGTEWFVGTRDAKDSSAGSVERNRSGPSTVSSGGSFVMLQTDEFPGEGESAYVGELRTACCWTSRLFDRLGRVDIEKAFLKVCVSAAGVFLVLSVYVVSAPTELHAQACVHADSLVEDCYILFIYHYYNRPRTVRRCQKNAHPRGSL